MGRTRDARKEDAIPGQSGWLAEPASRAGGATGCFGRESMLGIYIDGPSRALRYSSRAPRPGCPCPAASISSIKFGLVNELNLIWSSHRVAGAALASPRLIKLANKATPGPGSKATEPEPEVRACQCPGSAAGGASLIGSLQLGPVRLPTEQRKLSPPRSLPVSSLKAPEQRLSLLRVVISLTESLTDLPHEPGCRRCAPCLPSE